MVKDLLNRNKNILKALHGAYGFDFESDFVIQKHTGKFTLNSIKKELDVSDLSDTITVVVMTDVRYRDGYLYVAMACQKRFCINFPNKVYYSHIDDFYAKYVFEEIRKDENKTFYIISQSKHLTKSPKGKTIDKSVRFKYVRHFGYSNGYSRCGISQFDVVEIANTGRCFNIRTQNPTASTDINYYIDKSGYLIESKKETLKAKAANLRAKREKERANNAPLLNTIIELNNELQKSKKNIADAILTASSSNDFWKVSRATHYLNYAYISFESFKRKNENGTFNSMREVNNFIETINNDIEKALNSLTGE